MLEIQRDILMHWIISIYNLLFLDLSLVAYIIQFLLFRHLTRMRTFLLLHVSLCLFPVTACHINCVILVHWTHQIFRTSVLKICLRTAGCYPQATDLKQVSDKLYFFIFVIIWHLSAQNTGDSSLQAIS